MRKSNAQEDCKGTKGIGNFILILSSFPLKENTTRTLFQKATKKEEARAETRAAQNKTKVESNEIRIWNLGSLLQVEMSNGKIVECRNKDTCSRDHKPLNQTTKRDAKTVVDKMNNSKLKTSYEKKIISVTGFKKLGVAFQ